MQQPLAPSPTFAPGGTPLAGVTVDDAGDEALDGQETQRLLDWAAANPSAARAAMNPVKFGVRFENAGQAICAVDLVSVDELTVAGPEGGQSHLLIEGENLSVLTAMADDLRGQVAIAVLDPPYNASITDSLYADQFRPKGASAGIGHARWLSFMEPRLRAVRDTLRTDGMAFITIDVKEMWGLKLLCDEIFGSGNFRGVITHKVKAPAGLGQRDSFVFDVCEYVLCYAKDARQGPGGAMHREPISAQGCADYGRAIRKLGNPDQTVTVDAERPFTVTTYPDAVVEPVLAKDQTAKRMVKWVPSAFRTTNAQGVARFMGHVPATGVATVEFRPTRGPNAGELKTHTFLNGRLVVWLSDSADIESGLVVKRTRETNLWTDNLHQGLGAEGGVRFPNGKKPVTLIRRLMAMTGHRDGIVLDCFAGSGTTGEAVLAENAADGGARRFVLITDNSSATSDGYTADGGESGICRGVTHPRLAGLFTGARPDGRPVEASSGTLVYLRAVPKGAGGAKNGISGS